MRKKGRIITIALLALIVLAVISHLLSKSACEKKVARWIAFEELHGNKFFVLPPRIEPSHSISNSIGAKTQIYNSNTKHFEGFPWAEVGRAAFQRPGIYIVHYGFNPGGLNGIEGTKKYLSIFGYCIELENKLSMVS